jgi:hypothetical protein
MWTLILTVILAQYGNRPQAVTVDHVEGFGSQAQCLEAGRKWGEALMKQAPPGTQMSATCVPLVVRPPK